MAENIYFDILPNELKQLLLLYAPAVVFQLYLI